MLLRMACSLAGTAFTVVFRAVPHADGPVASESRLWPIKSRGALPRNNRTAILLGAVQIRAPWSSSSVGALRPETGLAEALTPRTVVIWFPNQENRMNQPTTKTRVNE